MDKRGEEVRIDGREKEKTGKRKGKEEEKMWWLDSESGEIVKY